MNSGTTTQTKVALPPGIRESDTKYRVSPKGNSDAAWRKWHEGAGKMADPSHLTFYYTQRFGWVVTTLHIGKSQAYADRSYGITLKGDPVRVGRGPHVLRELQVLVYADRLPDLQQYVDLYNKGLVKAHETRDVISTRRAAGALRRRSSWDMFR